MAVEKTIGFGTQGAASSTPSDEPVCSDCDQQPEMSVEVAPKDQFSAKTENAAADKKNAAKSSLGDFFSKAKRVKAELAEKAKEAQEKRTELQKRTQDLIRPLVDHAGTFDSFKFKTFKEFREFVLSQAEQNDGKSFSSPYADLLSKKEFEPLLRLLYQLHASDDGSEDNPVSANDLIEALLREFMAELIDIDADAFVGRYIGMKCCRDMLQGVIKDDRYSRDTRLDLLEAIRRMGRDYVDRGRIDNIDENLSWFNFNWSVSDSDLARATGSAIYIIEAIEKADAAREAVFKDAANEYARLAAEKKARPDTVSQLQSSLAEIVVTASNDEFIGQLKGIKDERGAERDKAKEKIRSYIINEAKRLYQAGETVKTDKDLARYNEELQKFLKGSLNHLFSGSSARVLDAQLNAGMGFENRVAVGTTPLDDSLNKGLADMVSGISATQRQPFDSLGSTTDMIHHAQSMGEVILDSATSAINEDKELKNAAEKLAEALTNTRLKLWHGYKQHGALSRGLSNVANVVGGSGNIARIEAANAELKEITDDILYAIDQNELETAIQRLQRGLEEDGVIHKAIDAAEMDGVETSINFLQTTLEIIAIALVTRGAGATLGIGRGAAAGGEAAINAASKVGRLGVAPFRARLAAGLKEAGIRSARGFGLGAQMSVAENVVSVATDQVGANVDIEKWIKDAIATGLSMAITGLLPPTPDRGSFLKNFWARYTVGGLRAVGRPVVDTGVETIEEVVDQLVRQALDGNLDALSFAQVAELARVCLAGGGMKVGAIAEAIKSKTQISEIVKPDPTGGTIDDSHPREGEDPVTAVHSSAKLPVDRRFRGNDGTRNSSIVQPDPNVVQAEPTLAISTPLPVDRSSGEEAKIDAGNGETPVTWTPGNRKQGARMPWQKTVVSSTDKKDIKYTLIPDPKWGDHFILWSDPAGGSYEMNSSIDVIRFKVSDAAAVEAFLSPKRPSDARLLRENVVINEGDGEADTVVTLHSNFKDSEGNVVTLKTVFVEISSIRELAERGYQVEVELPKAMQEEASKLGEVKDIGDGRILLTIEREADIPVLDVAAEFGERKIEEVRPVAKEDAAIVPEEEAEPSDGSPTVAPQIEYLHAGFDPRPGLKQGWEILRNGARRFLGVRDDKRDISMHSMPVPNGGSVRLMAKELVIQKSGRAEKITVEVESDDQSVVEKRVSEIAERLTAMPPAMFGGVRTIRVLSKNAESYGYEACSSASSKREGAMHIYDGADIRTKGFKKDVDWDLHDLRHEMAHLMEGKDGLEEKIKHAIELGGGDAERFYLANAFKSEWKKNWSERWATAVAMYLDDPAKFKAGDPHMAELIEAELGLNVTIVPVAEGVDGSTAAQPVVYLHAGFDPRPGLKQGLALLQKGIEWLFPGSEAKQTQDEVIGQLRYADIESSFIEPRVEWGYHNPKGVHGLGHISRVQVLSNIIARALIGKGREVNVKALRWAAVLHDVARIDDQGDPKHGIRSAQWARTHLKELDPSLTEQEIEFVAHLIEWHVPPDSRYNGEMPIELLILKDADSLDRVRLGGGATLNPEFLRTGTAVDLIDFAEDLYSNSRDLLDGGLPWPNAVLRAAKKGLAFLRSQEELDRGGPDTFKMSALQMLGFEIYDGFSRIVGSEAGTKNIKDEAGPKMLDNRHLDYKGVEWVPERQITENIFYYKNKAYTGKTHINKNKALFVRVVDGVVTLLDRETARKLVMDAYEYKTGQKAITSPEAIFTSIKAIMSDYDYFTVTGETMMLHYDYSTVTDENEALQDLAYFADGQPEGIPSIGILTMDHDPRTYEPYKPIFTEAQIQKYTRMAPTLALVELGKRTLNKTRSYSGCFDDILLGPNGKIELERYGPLLQGMQSKFGDIKLGTDREKSLAVDLYLRFSKVDEKALNALGFNDAIDAVKKVWEVYVRSYNENLPPLAPKMLAIEQIPEIVEKLAQYAPVESLNHGSTSASLPGVVAGDGLLPARYILQEDNPMLFSGELVFQLHETGKLQSSTSTVHFSRADPAQPQIQVPGYTKWSADVVYARSKGNEFRKGMSSDHLTKSQKAKRERKVAYMRKAWMNGLPPLEQAMVAEEFPVVYQVRQFDKERVINHRSETHEFAAERAYYGKLALGKNITEIFVPRDKIKLVKEYLSSHGFDNVDVLPIENLEIARMLLIEKYKLFHWAKKGKSPIQEYLKGVGATLDPQTNELTNPQYEVVAPLRTRAFGAPLPGVKGRYEARLSPEERANNLPGPMNTFGLDEAAPFGKVGARRADAKVEIERAGNRAVGAPAARTDISLEAGSKVYHIKHGPIEILGTEKRGDLLFVEIMLRGKRVKILYHDADFMPFGSPQAQEATERIATKRYKHLPAIIGYVYIRLNSGKYADVLDKFFDDLLKRNGTSGYRQWLPKRMLQYLTGVDDNADLKRYTGQHSNTTSLTNADVENIQQLFEDIYKATGDDVVEFGLRTFRSMEDMMRIYDDITANWKLGVMTYRDDVLDYYNSRRSEFLVANKFSPEGRAQYSHVFSVGDYDADKRAYDALREGDPSAIQHWADPMAAAIKADARLASADIIIPIMGRENWGWPVKKLADKIGESVGIEVRSDLFKPRPTDAKPGEARQSFGEKEEQAKKSYRLRRTKDGKTFDPDVVAAAKGKTVVLIDDNYTTGSAFRAAAGELRKAGAKEVYIVTATRTNRYQDTDADTPEGGGGSGQGTVGSPYIPRRGENPATDAEFLGGDFGASLRAKQRDSEAKISKAMGREFRVGEQNGAPTQTQAKPDGTTEKSSTLSAPAANSSIVQPDPIADPIAVANTNGPETLMSVESIGLPGMTLDSRDAIKHIVERPLRAAVEVFYDKNIRTAFTSANRNDVARGYATITLDAKGLTNENKEVLRNLAPELVASEKYRPELLNDGRTSRTSEDGMLIHEWDTESRIDRQSGVRVVFGNSMMADGYAIIYIPIDHTTTVAELSAHASSIAEQFKYQDPDWRSLIDILMEYPNDDELMLALLDHRAEEYIAKHYGYVFDPTIGLYRNSTEWTKEGFFVENVLKGTKGPFIEIGGPTPDGYRLIGDIGGLAKKVGRKFFASNITPGLADYDVRTGKFLGFIETIDLRADANGLPFSDGSVGALFSSCIDWKAKSFEEAYRTLENGGFLVMQGYREADFENARKVGFVSVKNSYSRVQGESVVIFQKPINNEERPTPGSNVSTSGGPYIPRRGAEPATDAEFLGGDFGASLRTHQHDSEAKISKATGREFHVGEQNGAPPSRPPSGSNVPATVTVAINGGDPVAIKAETTRILIGQEPSIIKDPEGVPKSAHVRIKAGDQAQCSIERTRGGEWFIYPISQKYPTIVILPSGKTKRLEPEEADSGGGREVISFQLPILLQPGKNVIEVEGRKITINVPESETPTVKMQSVDIDRPSESESLPRLVERDPRLKISTEPYSGRTTTALIPAELAYDARGKVPSLVGQIDGLTAEMEAQFRRGTSIDIMPYMGDDNGGATYGVNKHAKGSFGMTRNMEIINPTDPEYDDIAKQYEIYEAWKAAAGMAYSENSALAQMHFDRLRTYLNERGIELVEEEPTRSKNFDSYSATQYQEVLELLRLCPQKLLRSGAIRKIVLNSDRRSGARVSEFDDGDVVIYKDLLRSNKRMLWFFFLHEVGHGVFEGLPQSERQRLDARLADITRTHKVITVDTPMDDAASRIGYVSNLDEFLAEFNSLYVLAGDHLRKRIAGIKNRKVREAYQEFYNIFKNLHNGREFTSQP